MIDYTQIRYNHLLKDYFLPEEALYYSQFPISISGMRKLRTLRKHDIKLAQWQGITDIEQFIRDGYKVRGLTSKQGELQVDKYAQRVNEELMKPHYERESVLIEPERYNEFLSAKQQYGLKPSEAFNFTQIVSSVEWGRRFDQYQYLLYNHYTEWEAMKIITAVDPSGKLQPLDLTHPIWQEEILDRQKWFARQMQIGKEMGLTQQQSIAMAKKNIYDYYKADSNRTPFDHLKDLSPSGKPKANVDFADGFRRRRYRTVKKKPWAS
jgi:hypothetical protein